MNVCQARLGHVLGRCHHDPAFYIGALRCHLLDQGPEVWIKKDVLVFRMIDNVNNLFWE